MMSQQIQVNENKRCFDRTICNTHAIFELYLHISYNQDQ